MAPAKPCSCRSTPSSCCPSWRVGSGSCKAPALAAPSDIQATALMAESPAPASNGRRGDSLRPQSEARGSSRDSRLGMGGAALEAAADAAAVSRCMLAPAAQAA